MQHRPFGTREDMAVLPGGRQAETYACGTRVENTLQITSLISPTRTTRFPPGHLKNIYYSFYQATSETSESVVNALVSEQFEKVGDD